MARDLIKSDLTVNHCKPEEKPYRLNDGGGLVLLINPDNSKYWRFNYTFQTKRKTISLGTYPDIGLKRARKDADDCRTQLSDGINPSQIRKDHKQAVQKSIENEQRITDGIALENSFTQVSQLWLAAFYTSPI